MILYSFQKTCNQGVNERPIDQLLDLLYHPPFKPWHSWRYFLGMCSLLEKRVLQAFDKCV